MNNEFYPSPIPQETEKLKPGAIVTNNRFVYQIMCIQGNKATCRFLFNPVEFEFDLKNLRYLAPQDFKLKQKEIDLDQLIRNRNLMVIIKFKPKEKIKKKTITKIELIQAEMYKKCLEQGLSKELAVEVSGYVS